MYKINALECEILRFYNLLYSELFICYENQFTGRVNIQSLFTNFAEVILNNQFKNVFKNIYMGGFMKVYLYKNKSKEKHKSN